MTSAVRPEAARAAVQRPERLWIWWFRNLGRLSVYLLCASAAASVVLSIGYGLAIEGAAVGTLDLFIWGALFCLPGWSVWLIGIGSMPPEWSDLRRRAIAVPTGAMLAVLWQILLLGLGAWSKLAIWGVLLPMGSGFVVALRERVPAQAATTGVSSAM